MDMYSLDFEPEKTRGEKIKEAAFTFFSLSVALMFVLILFRVLEFSLSAISGKAASGVAGNFVQALWYDTKLWIIFSGVLCLPFLLVSLLSKKFGNIFYYVIAGIFLLVYLNLIFYYQIALIPWVQIFMLTP